MNKRKNLIILAGFVLSVSLLSVSLTVMLLTDYFSFLQMHITEGLCREIIKNEPAARDVILSVLKEYKYRSPLPPEKSLFLAYGYRQADFVQIAGKNIVFLAAAGFLSGAVLFLATFLYRHKKELSRINALTEYLEGVNTGRGGIFLQNGRGNSEDDFSKLQDEIYKTVTELQQTKESAVKARNNFAENLYNIAHQLKTPVTSISLSAQRVRDILCKASCGGQNRTATHSDNSGRAQKHLNQIDIQLSRLIRLEEALLLLSRIDSGALSLNRKEVDVFTLLMLAADNLQELSAEAEVAFHIPETGEILICVDLDWTIEALVNLMKNCMEHTPKGGAVCCGFEQNPLYTRIRIWDTGSGFAGEDIPRLFERFYRGKDAAEGGIGIGLAISKAIIEGQNGTLTARNLPEGGALFEIRFYSH